MTRDKLVARLIRAGELEVSGEDQTETDLYFTEASTASTALTVSRRTRLVSLTISSPIRAAFDDRSIRRGIIVAEGNYIASRIWSAA